MKADVAPVHTEYKDDRFVAAFERNGSDKATFAVAYVVRAVSPGKYVLPAGDHRGHVSARTFWPHRFRRGGDYGGGENETGHGTEPGFIAAVLIGFVGLAVPGAWLNFQRVLGPLDLSALERASTVALDRDGQGVARFRHAGRALAAAGARQRRRSAILRPAESL